MRPSAILNSSFAEECQDQKEAAAPQAAARASAPEPPLAPRPATMDSVESSPGEKGQAEARQKGVSCRRHNQPSPGICKS